MPETKHRPNVLCDKSDHESVALFSISAEETSKRWPEGEDRERAYNSSDVNRIHYEFFIKASITSVENSMGSVMISYIDFCIIGFR
jgi:hypothetical protein